MCISMPPAIILHTTLCVCACVRACVRACVCVCVVCVFVLYALKLKNICSQRMCKRLGPVRVRRSKYS